MPSFQHGTRYGRPIPINPTDQQPPHRAWDSHSLLVPPRPVFRRTMRYDDHATCSENFLRLGRGEAEWDMYWALTGDDEPEARLHRNPAWSRDGRRRGGALTRARRMFNGIPTDSSMSPSGIIILFVRKLNTHDSSSIPILSIHIFLLDILPPTTTTSGVTTFLIVWYSMCRASWHCATV